jgi:hypothetical protein
VKLDDDSVNTSSGVDGKKRRLLALGSAGNATLQKSINARTRLHVHWRPTIGSGEQKALKARTNNAPSLIDWPRRPLSGRQQNSTTTGTSTTTYSGELTTRAAVLRE